MPFCFRLILALLAGTAAWYDLRVRKLPNWLTGAGIFTGFSLNLCFGGLAGFETATEGLLLASAIYFPFYLLRGMGAGDVKLMAAIGSIAGPRNWLIIFIYTALLGGSSGVVLTLIKGRFTETCINVRFALFDLINLRAPYSSNAQMDVRNQGGIRMPHAVLISTGTAVFLSGLINL